MFRIFLIILLLIAALAFYFYYDFKATSVGIEESKWKDYRKIDFYDGPAGGEASQFLAKYLFQVRQFFMNLFDRFFKSDARILLNNGSVVDGRIVKQGTKGLWVETNTGVQIYFKYDEIEKIQYIKFSDKFSASPQNPS